MPSALHLSLLLAAAVLAGGCVGPNRSLFPPPPGQPTHRVYVINQGGLHTGIAMKWQDIDGELWPAKMEYPSARFLEAGWGDHDGYRYDLTPWSVLKGLFWPTRSVLQMDGFDGGLEENFNAPGTTIIEVELSKAGFSRLCRYIGDSYYLDEAGRPIALGDDWYQARGKYCLFKTCNTWVAKGLRTAGCPVTPAYCITRGPLLFQARKFGRVVSMPAADPCD